MNVPFLDLKSSHARIRGEIDAAISAVVDKAAFIQGPFVQKFEDELATFMERTHAKGVATGTAALTITLRSLKLQPGDEVITTVHTAIPTAEAITLAGGKVVFADIEDDSWQISPAAIEAAITERTRAILVVHLYGLAARMNEILAIASRHSLPVIEDCAQAQGARLDSKRLGTFGLAGCLSFFPSKNLGGFGDGGAVVTNDEPTFTFVKMYSNHGRLEKFTHEFEGANERLDGLQAAILSVKMAYLDEWNANRRKVAAWYAEELAGIDGLQLPAPIAGCEPVWHLYVVRHADRDGLKKHLGEKGIATGLHFPLSLNQQPAYAWMNRPRGSFPVAERVTDECISLPMDPFQTREQVQAVAAAVKEYCTHPATQPA